MANQSSPDYANAIVASFDKSLKNFSFRRTIPIAIFVDGEINTEQIGRQYAEIVTGIFTELEFSVTVLRVETGSFCQLNICESKVPLDEPSLNERLRRAREAILHVLSNAPAAKLISATGSAATVLVAIGKFIQFAHGDHTADIPVIGHYAIPTPVWTVLLAFKESKSFIKDCREMLTGSKEFKKALSDSRKGLKQDRHALDEKSVPKLADTNIQVREINKEGRIRMLEAKMEEFRKEIDELKKEE